MSKPTVASLSQMIEVQNKKIEDLEKLMVSNLADSLETRKIVFEIADLRTKLVKALRKSANEARPAFGFGGVIGQAFDSIADYIE